MTGREETDSLARELTASYRDLEGETVLGCCCWTKSSKRKFAKREERELWSTSIWVQRNDRPKQGQRAEESRERTLKQRYFDKQRQKHDETWAAKQIEPPHNLETKRNRRSGTGPESAGRLVVTATNHQRSKLLGLFQNKKEQKELLIGCFLPPCLLVWIISFSLFSSLFSRFLFYSCIASLCNRFFLFFLNISFAHFVFLCFLQHLPQTFSFSFPFILAQDPNPAKRPKLEKKNSSFDEDSCCICLGRRKWEIELNCKHSWVLFVSCDTFSMFFALICIEFCYLCLKAVEMSGEMRCPLCRRPVDASKLANASIDQKDLLRQASASAVDAAGAQQKPQWKVHHVSSFSPSSPFVHFRFLVSCRSVFRSKWMVAIRWGEQRADGRVCASFELSDTCMRLCYCLAFSWQVLSRLAKKAQVTAIKRWQRAGRCRRRWWSSGGGRWRGWWWNRWWYITATSFLDP